MSEDSRPLRRLRPYQLYGAIRRPAGRRPALGRGRTLGKDQAVKIARDTSRSPVAGGFRFKQSQHARVSFSVRVDGPSSLRRSKGRTRAVKDRNGRTTSAVQGRLQIEIPAPGPRAAPPGRLQVRSGRVLLEYGASDGRNGTEAQKSASACRRQPWAKGPWFFAAQSQYGALIWFQPGCELNAPIEKLRRFGPGG